MPHSVAPQTNEVVFSHDPWRDLRAEFGLAALKREWRLAAAIALLGSGFAYYVSGKTMPSGFPSWSVGPLLVIFSAACAAIFRTILLYGIAFTSKLIVSDLAIGVKEPGRRTLKFGWGEVRESGVVLEKESAVYIQLKLVNADRKPCIILDRNDLQYFRQLVLKYGGGDHPLARVMR